MSMLDKKIIYFILVVDMGSFSAAARKVFLSQSAISQQISLLEQELSISLFDRTGYKPILTDAGRLFYEGCISIRNQCNSLEHNVKNINSEHLCIGFTGAFENKELLEVINKYNESSSGIEVSFLKNNFYGCVKDLLEGRTDLSFGLTSEFKNWDDISYETLFSYELCVICAPNHRLSNLKEIAVNELNEEKFIILSPNYGRGFYKEFMNYMRLDKIKPKSIKEVDTFDELVFHVSLGSGIGIVARSVVSDNNINILKLLDSHHKSEAAIAYRKNQDNNNVIEFIKACKRYFKTL